MIIIRKLNGKLFLIACYNSIFYFDIIITLLDYFKEVFKQLNKKNCFSQKLIKRNKNNFTK